ncbi:ABC transporter ATP-binding protein [Catellatospora citrea]|uniref:ABC transporter ATP-binding protein n=1 Tax=Catellatospora citrea TaxID=53366 RepID=UPI0033D11E56
MTSVHPVLEVRDLHVGFGPRKGGVPEVRAVDGVELTAERGQIIALAGESGCGKTTLARTLLGLAQPWRGQVLYHGKPLDYRNSALKAYRRKVQLVLQDPTGALNPRRTVYEAVAEGLRIHRVPGDERAQVAQALSLAGLRPAENFFGRYPHELSGGQRQRVVIAGALVLNPEVIVADEPVSSLDASVRGEILALLMSLRDELGLTVLVVTHDLGLAWNIADQLAVMYLGRIVEIGRTEQVLAAPKHPYTEALLSVLPETRHREPVILTGEAPDPRHIPDGCRFHPRCPALADGRAQRAGIADRCVGEPLQMLPLHRAHAAACLLPGHIGDGIAGAAGGVPTGVTAS